MREAVAGDLVTCDEHATAVRIEPHLFRKHFGALGEIGMNSRRDRADRVEVGCARVAPMRLAHLNCSVSTNAIYSVALLRAAKNISAPF
ncbi:hypothetical protein ACVWYH_007691 [Bradyrhizobium sp. GM24.11]